MNKQEFIDRIAKDHNITKKEAGHIIDCFTASVKNSIADLETVNIIGFGQFTITRINEKEGRNPRTGEKITIKARNQVGFKAGKSLKDAANS